MSNDHERSHLPDALQQAGGLQEGVARELSRKTGLPEAEIYGVASFFHLLADPNTKLRVCTGLSCQLAGADDLLAAAKAAGLPVAGCSCLAACDVAPAVLKERRVLPSVTRADLDAAGDDWTAFHSSAAPGDAAWKGAIGPERDDPEQFALNLHGALDRSASAFAKAQAAGVDALFEQLESAGLQGRGGAGFPAHIKWRAVHGQPVTTRYVVLNADEAEPATFKDREILLRRPDKVLEGLAIAAWAVGATEVWLYLRGEFEIPLQAIEAEIERAHAEERFGEIRFHTHSGQGAYICGEETALLEALEGKRGMPRLRPPYPVEVGLWGKPTLVHNVETIACVPAIVERGGEWFRSLGRVEAGSKLYCISGHVTRPGVYEAPLGITLDELVEMAGGYVGELKAFSPGGASSGFLPAAMRDVPMDYKSLADAGSMLGSAGVVVLNDTVDMRWAVQHQLRFFEDESCGQCAPCRIGTYYLRDALDKSAGGGPGSVAEGSPQQPGAENARLAHVADVAWQMNEGSICGLGQAAPLPLTTALKHFPEEFASPRS